MVDEGADGAVDVEDVEDGAELVRATAMVPEDGAELVRLTAMAPRVTPPPLGSLVSLCVELPSSSTIPEAGASFTLRWPLAFLVAILSGS